MEKKRIDPLNDMLVRRLLLLCSKPKFLEEFGLKSISHSTIGRRLSELNTSHLGYFLAVWLHITGV